MTVQPLVKKEKKDEGLPGSSRMSTGRTRRLRERMLEAPNQVSIDRARIFTEAFAAHRDESLVVRRALAYDAVLRGVPIAIHEDELVVGGITDKRNGAILLPETRHSHMPSLR